MKLPTNPLLTLLLCWFTTLSCFGQIEPDEQMKVLFDASKIKANGIRSVIVFEESSEEDLEKSFTTQGKSLEAEFDSNGQMTYRLTASNGGNGYNLYYDRGSIIEYFSYDDAGRKSRFYSERFNRVTEKFLQYDSSGNTVQSKILFDGKIVSKVDFQWSEGKMIKASVSTKSNSKEKIIYDEEGRIILTELENYKSVFQYKRAGDTLLSEEKSYTSGKLKYIVTTKRLIFFDRLLYNQEEKVGPNPRTERKTYAYDQHGNLVRSETIVDRKLQEELMDEVPEDESNEILVENEYNEQGLIIRRSFYLVFQGKRQLITVEHYVYETTPLIRKLPEGFFKEMHEEYEYNNSDSIEKAPVELEDEK